MNFDAFCIDNKVTKAEREQLAHHLAGIRYRETLKLAEHPITRAAMASAAFAADGKVDIIKGGHVVRINP